MANDQVRLMDRFRQLSSGERAALCREAGKCMTEASARALSVFFQNVPPELSRWQQECWFAAMTIACLWNPEEASVGDALPIMLRKYSERKGTGGMESKIRSLLDLHWENDGFLASKLSRLARMLRSENRQIMPDMEQLLEDLLRWNYDSRIVQLRWAQQYYQVEVTENSTEEE